jgi:hypothetical protein
MFGSAVREAWDEKEQLGSDRGTVGGRSGSRLIEVDFFDADIAMDGEAVEIADGVVGVEEGAIEEFERIAIGFCIRPTQLSRGFSVEVNSSDAIENFNPVFREGGNPPAS